MAVVALQLLPHSPLGRLPLALLPCYSTSVGMSDEMEALQRNFRKNGGAARLLVTERSAAFPSRRLLPVLVSWTGASHRALAKYGSLYTEQGLHTVCVVPSIFQMWSSVWGNALSSSVLRSINSSLRGPTKLLLHMFSSAPDVILPSLAQVLSDCSNLSLSGVVCECGPVQFSYKAGYAASKSMYEQGGFSLPTYLAANMAGTVVNTLVGRKRRQQLSAALHSDMLAGVPQLFLYSQNDTVAPRDWVQSVIKEQEVLGREVETHCFAGGDHVRQLVTHPQEYRERLTAFLNRHYLTQS